MKKEGIMIKEKITFVHTADYDWMGMYIDGKLAAEGHNLDYKVMLDALGIDHKIKTVSNESVENSGCMPKQEKDCEFI
jgi:hypothetical protein